MTPVHHAPALSRIDGVAHGFFGRRGGVSAGIYTSLNCGAGSDDDGAAVARNRDIVCGTLSDRVRSLHSLYQVHGDTVVEITADMPADARPNADAMICRQQGLALAILTADCVPVLFAEEGGQVIGAAHAGWKGALGGVLAATVNAMQAMGAQRDRIVAAVGPAIAQASYEVGADYRERFLVADDANARFFASGVRPGHFQFDLTGYVQAGLAALGLARIDNLNLDTYANENEFFSYRRSVHRDEPDYGRQISAIALI